MERAMRSLGVIQARGASKRLPRKNVRLLNGIPLIAYMCRAALVSRLQRVIVTTEDEEIARTAETFGVSAPFRRPVELAADYASNEDVVGHALEWTENDEGRPYDTVVKLQPTTPFVLPRHIDGCLDEVENNGAACCFTARKVSEPPDWMFRRDPEGIATPMIDVAPVGEWEHSQLLPEFFFPTGAAYAVRVSALRQQGRIYSAPLRMMMMEPERSIDIDDELDLLTAETVGRHFGFTPVDTP